MLLPKLLKSQSTVRFQDCDPYGHLYNSKYIDYFMNAREDQLLDNYNLDIYALSTTEGIGWVVAQNQIAYLQPALLMEKVWITSKIIDYSTKMITVEFEMWNTDESQLKAFMWSRFVHFDLKTRRSASHAQKFQEMFAQVHHPIDTQSFEERVKRVRM
ncbi:MAG TPA: acyl-CoA thioesterase [Saprospiraceae bacterium]|nr:acyl-CoA thioesterase [Saprospiraceae bacterium]